MNKQRQHRIKQAMTPEGRRLDALTPAELSTLERYGFDAANFLKNHVTSVITTTPQETKEASKLIGKLDDYAKEHRLTEAAIFHLNEGQ